MMVQFDVKRVQKGTESFMVSFDFTKTPVTQIVDYIIIAASKHNSSDIHFDPREDGMMVRFRIDGDLQDYTFVPKAYEKNLATRIKLLSNMNITESRLPQDGAIKGNFGDTYLDMRVSSLPLNEGEKIVIRILDYTRSLQGIDSLGFHPKNLEKIKRMMSIPNGIILTTGATGSGKSTTTYSILQGLNKPETNIITVEDPIEMNIEGINQVQVNAEIGMTFAAALRSILRQDPNIILIGEIRDSETAQIAVRASITGHLVLSTIHTNNALATVERLLDMDVERYLLSTALSGIISQRLAKMLCPTCRYQRNTTKYEQKVFKKFMNMDVLKIWDSNPKGCEHCRRGYRGRIAIHEVLEIDDDIRSALSNDKVEKKDLAKMVYSGNTITMLQDALIKCLEGKTSFEEVYKNIEIENEDDDNYENEINKKKEEAIKKEEVEEESDDLLEPIKKDNKNDIKNIITPPTFTAEDFNDTKKDKNQEVKIPNIIPNKDKQTENTKSNTIIKIPTFTSNNQNTNNPINNLIKKPVVPAVPISQNKKEENIPRL
ncbi:MAG: Flp pilus assembly complex ATPase component TadA [Bacilli bacterium]|nr:Flp pilus assembly complex ATPase component TadA [Bacilli bacterium]